MFGLQNFLEIEYDDTLQQCLTSSIGKTHKKRFLGPNLGQTDQNRDEIRFLQFSQVCLIKFLLNCLE